MPNMKEELRLEGRLPTKTGGGFVFPGLYHQVTEETTGITVETIPC